MEGTEHDAAAKLTLEGATALGGGDGESVTLEGGRSAPLWLTVFWCLRCGDHAAAVRVMQRAASQQAGSPSSWRAWAVQDLASALV